MIDYVYVNFKELQPKDHPSLLSQDKLSHYGSPKKQQQSANGRFKSRLQSLPPQQSSTKPLTSRLSKQASHGAVGTTGEEKGKAESFAIMDMTDQQKKLLRKGVLPSLSLAFKKPTASLLIGSHKLRTVRRDDKKKSTA